MDLAKLTLIYYALLVAVTTHCHPHRDVYFSHACCNSSDSDFERSSILRHLYLEKSKGYEGDSFRLVSRPLVLVNAVKSLPPSVRLGAQEPPKLVARVTFSKLSLFAAATVPKCVAPTIQKLFYFVLQKVPSRCRLKFGANTSFCPLGCGAPTPKKVFPQFVKIVRGQGQNFDCVIRGPQGAYVVKFW